MPVDAETLHAILDAFERFSITCYKRLAQRKPVTFQTYVLGMDPSLRVN